MTVERSGRLWILLPDGTIVNDAAPEKIVPPFVAPVRDLVSLVRERLSDSLRDVPSLYLTGSIARGIACPGLSDLDGFLVLPPGVTPQEAGDAELEEASTHIADTHDCISSSQLEVWDRRWVETIGSRFNFFAFVIQTHSVLLAGPDLSNQLPRYRLTAAVPNDDIVQIQSDIEEAVRELWNETDPRDTPYWCRRIAKNILRCGFSLVQLTEGVHTRDLVLCVEACKRHFSNLSGLIDRAYALTVEPTPDRAVALAFLSEAMDWLIPEANRWLDRYNPSRELALELGTSP